MDSFKDLATAGIFGAAGGGLSYWLKSLERKAFSWGELIAHTLSSAMFGVIAVQLGQGFHVDPSFLGALAGIAGWMGTRCVRIAELVIRQKLGVKDE